MDNWKTRFLLGAIGTRSMGIRSVHSDFQKKTWDKLRQIQSLFGKTVSFREGNCVFMDDDFISLLMKASIRGLSIEIFILSPWTLQPFPQNQTRDEKNHSQTKTLPRNGGFDWVDFAVHFGLLGNTQSWLSIGSILSQFKRSSCGGLNSCGRHGA